LKTQSFKRRIRATGPANGLAAAIERREIVGVRRKFSRGKVLARSQGTKVRGEDRASDR